MVAYSFLRLKKYNYAQPYFIKRLDSLRGRKDEEFFRKEVQKIENIYDW